VAQVQELFGGAGGLGWVAVKAVVLVQVLYLPTLMIALLVGLAIWRSSRTDAPPSATAGN
jgi:hypothetical protein